MFVCVCVCVCMCMCMCLLVCVGVYGEGGILWFQTVY